MTALVGVGAVILAVVASPAVAPRLVSAAPARSLTTPKAPCVALFRVARTSPEPFGRTGVAALAVADFDNDGRDDLAASLAFDGLAILLARGRDDFATTKLSIASGSIAVGDFNRDEHIDLVVGGLGTAGFGGSDAVTVLLGDGTGEFVAQPASYYGPRPRVHAVSDFNADGRDDIVLTTDVITVESGYQFYDSVLRVILGGTSGFTNAPGSPILFDWYDPPVSPQPDGGFGGGGERRVDTVMAGDVNGDRLPDLLASAPVRTGVQVFLGSGTGAMSPLADSTDWRDSYSEDGYGGVGAIALGDANGDDRPDLIAARFGFPATIVLLGDGAGRFQEPAVPRRPGQWWYIATADFNADDRLDVVASRGTRRGSVPVVLLGHGTGRLRQAPDLPVLADWRPTDNAGPFGVGDFNRDGRADLAVIRTAQRRPTGLGATIDILLNNGGDAARGGVRTPPALLARRSPATVVYGHRVTLSTRLACDRSRPAGHTLVLYRRVVTSHRHNRWYQVGGDATDSDGRAQRTDRPPVNMQYQWRPMQGSRSFGTASRPVAVRVAPAITMRGTQQATRIGGTASFIGRVSPPHPGYMVVLQQAGPAGWRKVSSKRLGSRSHFRFTVAPNRRGEFLYRVRRPSDPHHAAGTSDLVSLRVLPRR
jgi:hypothetical protein